MHGAEGNTGGGASASRNRAPRGRRPRACTRKHLAREPGDLVFAHEEDGNVGRDGKSKDEKPEMNEHEKSDHPIVPAKPPNNGTGEQPRPAEVVEGRGWAKGNPGQHNTSRTQSRVKDVPSALERIRQAAERSKEERFTALYHHICNPEMLRRAYVSLKREAAPGNRRPYHDRWYRGAGSDGRGSDGRRGDRIVRVRWHARTQPRGRHASGLLP